MKRIVNNEKGMDEMKRTILYFTHGGGDKIYGVWIPREYLRGRFPRLRVWWELTRLIYSTWRREAKYDPNPPEHPGFDDVSKMLKTKRKGR